MNMISFSALVLASVVFAYTAAFSGIENGYEGSHYHIPGYHFEYGVQDPHTGDHKTHEESRENDIVRGSYTIDDPDGTKRIVEYIAGDHIGFRATVKRILDAHHSGHGENIVEVTHWGY